VLEVGSVLVSGLARDLHDDPSVKAAYLGGDVTGQATPATPDPSPTEE
jgi:hypothetical protein